MRLPDLTEARKRTKNKTEVSYDKYKVPTSIHNIGHNKKYTILTYGCQMNVHDSENISGIMEDLGYTKEDNYENADVIIINTCAIRENAQNKVVGILGRIKKLKETNPNIITIIGGCMPQEESVSGMIKDKYKWVDIVLGTHNIYDIPTLLDNINKERKQNIEVYSIEGSIIENLPVKRDSKIKAWVNIQYGCDKFCSYCIVPYTRGKQRSRLPEDILKEVKSLKEKGYKEVTLLGQNVNAYGKDLYDNYTMANLLEDVALTGMERIRFITSHPWDFTDEMIEVIKKYPNVLNHVHLPVQSGNSDILKLMGRRYTKEEYLILYNKLKNEIPNISITTDIIVGFPGETNEQFEDTLDLVEKCKFDLAYTFIFSKRVGTPAYNMKDETSMEEKEERLQRLNELINKYALINNKKLINKEENVLVEGFSSKNSDLLMGYTETNKLVNFKGDPSLIGKIVKVKILDAKTWSLDGEYVK